MINPLENNALEKVQELCARHHVASLYLFGSATGSEFSTDSDIDFVVAFKPGKIQDFASNFFSLQQGLEKLFNRKVDLVTERSIRNPYFREAVDESKVLLYGSLAA
ncbi:MAG: hypothetical protein EOP50_04535 [Sphingobacteriales bacterium]|nr:MAG: hypothetical protein EOP50_04535 [Sphingobacteriales bacterium]